MPTQTHKRSTGKQRSEQKGPLYCMTVPTPEHVVWVKEQYLQTIHQHWQISHISVTAALPQTCTVQICYTECSNNTTRPITQCQCRPPIGFESCTIKVKIEPLTDLGLWQVYLPNQRWCPWSDVMGCPVAMALWLLLQHSFLYVLNAFLHQCMWSCKMDQWIAKALRCTQGLLPTVGVVGTLLFMERWGLQDLAAFRVNCRGHRLLKVCSALCWSVSKQRNLLNVVEKTKTERNKERERAREIKALGSHSTGHWASRGTSGGLEWPVTDMTNGFNNYCA